MNTKIPDRLFVGLRYGYTADDHLVGFHTTYEDESSPAKLLAAFEKRKHTLMTWAYGESYSSPLDRAVFKHKDGYQYIEGVLHCRTYTCWNGGDPVYTNIPVPDILKPRVLDNEFLPGFKILSSVSRISTSNKLWNILDPRGFVLEISTDALEEVLMNTTITKGVIEARAKWAAGKSLILDL